MKKQYAAGDTVTLTVYRSGETMTVELTWDAVPAEQQVQEDTQSSQNNSQGNGGYVDPNDLFEYFFGRR